ncbi:uncharacterized protein BT62DRAFT_277010 [Guyanagaster necrorhizus]|uniref:Uncharacterized protein n=1 Tax=Guyanagaster necrorhizus TaxID=856835 RepID=A0A9P7W2A3_9AGAR|nr:uncharacterized protein BT62DRAFT_277010 [Guyanagaster necrorhizus MCA 3950]KAG7452026.1 hypothetical protein BT62DRAFT_277010 [Guyanagaster necrorhizus MCA 3950]
MAETTPGPATGENISQSSSALSQSSSVPFQSFSSQSSVTSDVVTSCTSGGLASVATTSTGPTLTPSSSFSSTSLSSSQTIRVVISSSSTSAVPSTTSASSASIIPLSAVTSPPLVITSLAATSTAFPTSPSNPSSNPSSPPSDLSRTTFVPIIGAIAGAVVAVSAVLLVILFCLRRRRKRHCAKMDSGFAPYNSFKDEKIPNEDRLPQSPPPLVRVFHRVSSLLMPPHPTVRLAESRAQTPIHNPFAETNSFASSRVSWLSYVSSHPSLQRGVGTIEETMRSNPFDDPVDFSANTQTSSPLERVSSLQPGTTILERHHSTPLVLPPPESRFSMTASAELSPHEDPDRFSSWTDRKTMSRHSAMKDSPLQKLSMELHPVDVGSSNGAGTHLTGSPR